MAVYVFMVMLTAAVLTAQTAPVAASFIKCIKAGVNPAMTTVAVGAFDINVNLLCPMTCLQQGFAYAGISEGIHCFCSSNVSSLSLNATCDVPCSDGSLQCGADDNNVVALFSTGGGSPNFTYNITYNATAIKVTLKPLANWTTFLIDLGVGAPPSYVNQTSLTTDSYLVPGVHQVQVMGMIEGTSQSSLSAINLTQAVNASVDAVNCPIVWEPGQVYYCNVSVTMSGNNDSFSATFSNNLTHVLITSIGSEVYRRGTPPPRGISLQVEAPDSSTDEIRKPFLITKPSQILAFDMYAYESGTFTVSVQRATCTVGQYSVDAGGCTTDPPDDPLGISHTCPAANVFWPQQPACSDAAGVALTAAAPANWTDVVGTVVSGAFTGVGFHRERLPAPVDLFPGDVIAVTGPVGKSTWAPQGSGDTVADLQTTSHHYLSAIIKEEMPIQIPFNCTIVNLSTNLTVSHNGGAAMSLTNYTSCERNITAVVLKVSQNLNSTFNTSLNLQEPYYVRSNATANYTMVFSVAGPLKYTFSFVPSIGKNFTFNDTRDYPPTTVDYELSYPITVAVAGMYEVTVSAENKHNIYTGPVSYSTFVFVQNQVVTTWTVAPVSPQGFLIPTNIPQIKFNESSGAAFPTNASVRVTWGDGVTELLPFLSPSNNTNTTNPVFQHIYTTGGYYNITAYIFNVVSGYQVTCQIYIVEEIQNFVVQNKYFSSPTDTVGRKGFGALKNQYPMDKNLTFVPLMTQGTVLMYSVTNDTSGLLMFNYTVPDPFNPTLSIFNYFINFETVVNMTVHAVNAFQSVPYSLYVQMVGHVRMCQIDDFSIVVGKNVEKTFAVTFESVGAGTCLVVDWGDTNMQVVHSYGENATCQTGYPRAVYHSTPSLDTAINLTHTYTWEDMFNVTIYAFNNMSSCSSIITTPVTSIKCTPPVLAIEGGSLDFEAPIQFFKSTVNSIFTTNTINCEPTSNTKKQWQLYVANSTTGSLVQSIPTVNFYPSWNMSQLSIPARNLSYNLYVAWYTVTMWDPPVLSTKWTFQKQVMTYFQIIKTPLVAVLMENAVSLVMRGLSQQIVFSPGNFSIDPDDLNDKNFTVAYSCRVVGEPWPVPDTTPHPVWTKAAAGGCFGNGPGLLAYTDGTLILLGSDFVAADQTYEMKATITKDTRTASALGQVTVVDYVPPVISMTCVSVCMPTSDGVYINPSSRVGLRAECVQDCSTNMTYNWQVAPVNGPVFPDNIDYFPLGLGNVEVGLSTKFFDDNNALKTIMFSVTGAGSDGHEGLAAYFMKVNQRPAGGSCSLTQPPTRRALIDPYTLTCVSWYDPEGIGINNYVVSLFGSDGFITTLVDMPQAGGTSPQTATLVLPPGNFTITVQIFDAWGAFTYVNASPVFEVVMPSKEALDVANIQGVISMLMGKGDSQMLNMVLQAQSQVSDQAPWMAVDAKSTQGLTVDEINQRYVAKTTMINSAMTALQQVSTLNTMSNVNAAAGLMASMMLSASKDDVSILSIDTKARDQILQMSQMISESVLQMASPTPEAILQTLTLVATINSGMGMSQALSGNRQNGKCVVPPADVKNADSLDYSVYVSDVNMVVEEDPLNGVKCNVVDKTKQRAQTMVPGSDQVMNDLQTKLMQTMVVGETHNISTPNGVHITMGLLPVSSLLGRIEVGETGGAVTLPDSFCPYKNCSHDPALGFTVRQWPTNLFTFSGGADMLSPGTKIIEFSLHTRNLEELQVDDLPPEHAVYVHIPKTAGANGNTTLPAMVSVDAVNQSSRQIIPVIYTTFNVSVPQSTITLELAPDASNSRLFILIDKPRLPTLKSSMRFTLVNDLPVNNGTYTLFMLAKELAGLGRYFVGVGEFRKDFNMSLMDDPVTRNNVNMDVIKNISTNYKIRITVNGVAFLNKTTMKWETGGLEIINATETLTTCTTNHLTSFGASMFVMPNTVDFNYVFAHMGFTDNLTIYLTLIICLSIFVILLIWARLYDKKDLEKLGAAPLPDNKVEDKYVYEIAVFTGNIKGAQTDSVVQFILSGEHDETDVRTFGDDRRKILRKGDVDVFVMTVPRPLGALQLLRVWHDNSGKGVNASWFLSCIIITDVQTETKYHFIADQWFAVESFDGQVERLLPVAGEEEKKKFKFLMETNANSRLTDEHLWFSVFLRPKRSRFTRCQRVACCFGVLFLKMLVEAMWYEREPEKPSPGSLSLGPFNLSPEVVGIGLMSNLIVFPPTLLMVMFFRKARPRRLRRSRITLALERTRLSKSQNSESCSRSPDAAQHPPHSPPHSSDSPPQSGELSQESPHSNEPEKSEEKIEKSITLPWWFVLIAWALAVVCIGVSCFFLLMYGITFGNEKTTKWISALIISFFTEILLQEPIKIIVIAMVMSAICKTSDLEEDDSEEDQEEPQLESDEDWLHPGEESTHTRKHKRLDDETLERLRKERQQEIDMWKIMTEIVAYSIFLWVFLTITYGSRDPNTFLLHQSLSQEFLNEGRTGIDFTKVTNRDLLWRYLYHGLLPNLRAGKYYNEKPPYGLRGFLNDQSNRIMGYATIRQIRTKGTECRVPTIMRPLIKDCDGYGSISDEDSQDYCGEWIPLNSFTGNFSQCLIPEFRYTTAAVLNSYPIWGRREWYGGGGYVIHLRASTDAILQKFQELQRYQWIDHKTRAVLIEFAVYNSQVNLFGNCLIAAEFIPGGGIAPYGRFDGIHLLHEQDSFGSFITICEVVFVLFILYFTGRECYLLCKQGSKYFNSYWSFAEISIILASYISIIIYILRYLAVNAALKEFNRTYGNGYVRMQNAANLDEIFSYLIAFIVFVGTLKFIKLLRFNKTIGLLSATIRRCWDDLSVFLIAFVLFFFAFVSVFFVLLNQHLVDFYNFISAVMTCFSILLGKFDFSQMTQASPMVPILFFVFVMFITFVLMNLLITVIMQAFTEVKEDLHNQPRDHEIVDYVWESFKTFLRRGDSSDTAPRLISTPTVNIDLNTHDSLTVQEFPDKINKFLDYVNATYFEGGLDVTSKDAFKSSMYKSSAPRQGSGTRGTSFRDV